MASVGSSNSTRKRPQSTTSPDNCSKSRKRTMLGKGERLTVTKMIQDLPLETIIKKIEVSFREEVTSRDLGLSNIIDLLLVEKNLLILLVEYHRIIYLRIFNMFSTGKEKFLKFQLEWHVNCSILLLPKDVPVKSISPDLEEEKTSDIRKLWKKFCEPHPAKQCNNVMILFSSIMYNVLLQSSKLVDSSKSTSTETNMADDGDDVYYRFGGATLSSMLHLRYNATRIKELPSSSFVSQEILILQAINTKDKSSMPEYLRYRDRGYMYTPHPNFIPFFRDVDITVKEVVNTTGFQKYRNELIKVIRLITDLYMYSYMVTC